MLKKICIASIILLTFLTCHAQQIDPEEYSFGWSQDGKDTMPSLVSAHLSGQQYPINDKQLNDSANALFDNRTFYHHRRRNYFYSVLTDSSDIHFFVSRINPKNSGKFEFRVLLNARTPIVPWTPVIYAPTTIHTPGPDTSKLTWLGAYKIGMSQYLVVDLREKGTDSILSFTIAYRLPVRLELLNIYTLDEMNEFLKKLRGHTGYQDIYASNDELEKWEKLYPPNQLDPHTRLPKKLMLQPNDNSPIFYLRASTIKKDQIEYQLLKKGAIFADWKTNDFDEPFIWLKNLPPGEYRLDIRFPVQRERILSYPFEIKTPWHQSRVFKVVEGVLIAALLGFIILLFLNQRQRRRLIIEHQKKEKLETDIRAVRAQLNPHFIFNALSSIQGLINNGHIDKANNYLSDFANLMRGVLDDKISENNVLDHEIQTLRRYMDLEQLRFHFTYNITIAASLQPSLIQIPTLLLQPLVENAVKHGVSSLQERGRIDIGFDRSHNDMIVYIKDNGKGFDTSDPHDGYGLQLTRKRIALINEISSTQFIFMEMTSKGGTSIHLTFQNWLT